MSYRAEIDGLRAVAVSLVLLFHFFPILAPYGYVGVDLFFVISGYVITRQIYPNLQAGTFSFSAFFARRVRRILPLVFFAIAATIGVGYFLLLPTDFDRMADSAFAVATFWSNIFFWRDGGYFGSADKLKPLLHMWSLSVEEQFYLVFPLLLWLLVLVGRKRPGVVLLGVVAISALSLAIYAGLHTIGGATPAFFLMPSRVWQFGFGACAAILLAERKLNPSAALALLGIGGIVASGAMALPIYAENLLITFAGALYIAFASGTGVMDRVLSSPVMRHVGTRSFSLYVWHWPIVAYLNYAFVGEVPTWILLFALACCFLMSEVSFRLIEEPFRRTYRTPASFALISASAVACIGIYLLYWSRPPSGLMSALAGQIQTNFRCEISDFVPYGASRACLLGDATLPRDVALLGNSHAQMYAEAIVERAGTQGSAVILVPLNGCLPTTSVNISSGCMALAERNLLTILEDESVKTVVIGTTYPDLDLVDRTGGIPQQDATARLQQALLELVDTLAERKERVVLIGPIAVPGFDLASILGRSLRFGLMTEPEALARLSVPRDQFDARFAGLIAALSARLGRDFVRPDLLLCDARDCHFGNAQGSFFADSNHLGAHGIRAVAPMLDSF